MPSIVFSRGSLNNNSPIAVLFHTYFDMKWSLLEIAYMATNLRKYNENSRKSREKFMVILQQLEESLCGDLLYLAIRKFPEVRFGFYLSDMSSKAQHIFLSLFRYPRMIGQEQVLSIALVYGSCGSCYWSF
jgi:hypothetical protein